MKHRILQLLGGRRRRFVLGGAVALLAGGLFAITALAVHDEAFQLDGDVSASTTTNNGGHLQPFDWDSFFSAAGQKSPVLPDATRPGFTASSFDRDFRLNTDGTYDTSDPTTYTQGSKDINNISSNWVCTGANNVTSKGDIQNAYALAYTDPVSGDQKLYFGLERNSNNGDANVAFWFLQDANANCVAPAQGSTPWTGDHQTGDLLIVSAFTNGGAVSTITAYRWVGGANGAIDPTPEATGADCRLPGQPLNDPICATANTATITTPWLTNNNGKTNGLGHTLLTSEFFEGGINLTDTGLAGKCFNTFVGDTRSSQALTATLFDYARGALGECTSTTKTTPKKADGTTNISSEPIPATGTLDVTDSAKVDVTGVSSFSGSVTFFLCRSSELNASGQCETGGTEIGTAKTVTTPGQTVVSNVAGLTAVDHYCWRAEFSGDTTAGVPPSQDFATSECFDVTPLQPTLTTDATDGPVDFGSKISDTISLTGTANRPGTNGIGPGGTINATNRTAADGTISVTAFGPNNCTTHALDTSITVNGDNTAYGGPGSVTEFTPTAPGTYTYVASYSGDSPNTKNVSATACPDPSGAEAVLVRQIPTEIKTKQSWIPNDTATVSATSGNLAADGKVAFSLYASSDCSGSAVYSETKTLTGGSPTETVSTTNTGTGANGFTVNTAFTDPADSLTGYSWKVAYTPAAADTAHTGEQSACNAEHFSIMYTNDNGPGTNLP